MSAGGRAGMRAGLRLVGPAREPGRSSTWYDVSSCPVCKKGERFRPSPRRSLMRIGHETLYAHVVCTYFFLFLARTMIDSMAMLSINSVCARRRTV
ncbi:hypothetical protein Mapa_009106 [Marchantia paleacea]|nr:hypothetical protein Mapa_009106 [Marchantia paleacea]